MVSHSQVLPEWSQDAVAYEHAQAPDHSQFEADVLEVDVGAS
jgi:hypothetical protein